MSPSGNFGMSQASASLFLSLCVACILLPSGAGAVPTAVSPTYPWNLASLPTLVRPGIDWGGLPYSVLFNSVSNTTNFTGKKA